MYTIGLIDKHPIARVGIELMLRDEFYRYKYKVESCNTLGEFKNLHVKSKPKVLILGFANESSNECLNIINKCLEFYPSSNIIIFDEWRDAKSIKKFIESGIKGYAFKENDIPDLIKCIKSIVKGDLYLSESVLETLIGQFTADLLVNTTNTRKRRNLLTHREHDIAGYLCQGLRTNEIANLLNLKPSTVSTIKYNVFKKMRVKSVVELLKGYSTYITSAPQLSYSNFFIRRGFQ